MPGERLEFAHSFLYQILSRLRSTNDNTPQHITIGQFSYLAHTGCCGLSLIVVAFCREVCRECATGVAQVIRGVSRPLPY